MSTATVAELPADRSLNAIVAKIVETTDLIGPIDIAAEVARRLTDHERERIVARALVEAVRIALHAYRATPPTPPGKPRPSAKVRAIREGWQRILTTQWCVRGEWLRLEQFTEDLAFALANERRASAAEHLEQARRFELLAKAIADAGVEYAGQLDVAPEGWSA